MMILLATFCSSPWLGRFFACKRKGGVPGKWWCARDRIYTKRRPWHTGPNAIVKKRISLSADGWVGGSMLRP